VGEGQMKCVWLTGLPCSGKTTIANELNKVLTNSVVLDGDDLRSTYLGKNVGFSPQDRHDHILRMGEIAKLFVKTGTYAICSFISPEAKARDMVRELFNDGDFIEIHVSASKDTCAERDVKGMWKRAMNGDITHFTGFDAPYEEPINPEYTAFTELSTIKECVDDIIDILKPYHKPACMFIGRWNGIFHNGHDYIIRKKLDEGKSVTLAIRDVAPDKNNPWSAKQVKEMIDYRFKDYPDVKTIIIPDLESVEYGRGVGYEVNEIKVDKYIAGISGTECRKMILEGDDDWKQFVPDEVVEYLTDYNKRFT